MPNILRIAPNLLELDGMIPIVLLHHNQPSVLLNSVKAISTRTNFPYKLFVVDNSTNFTEELESVLLAISSEFGVHVIRNPKDNWVYGFNLAIESGLWPSSEFFAFSDADIYVPSISAGECWLSHLVRQMNENCCIGKLGLSLDLENLKNNPSLSSTYRIEKNLVDKGARIGGNIVAPVDTTMALYRHDFFVTDFKFRIGHGSLGRPHYYTCRTSPSVAGVHVGWDYYPGSSQFVPDIALQWQKAILFARMGAQVAPEFKAQFTFFRRSCLSVVVNFIRVFHSIKIAYFMGVYLIHRFPRNINSIQAQARIVEHR